MKAYIYCTKAKPYLTYGGYLEGGKEYILASFNRKQYRNLNGKVVAEFELNEVEKYTYNDLTDHHFESVIADLIKKSKVTFGSLLDYSKGKDLFAWHIGNLEIIEPLEISVFAKLRKSMKQENKYYIHKAPQSYQYAYYKGEKVIILSVRPEWVVKILNGEKTIEVRKTAPKEVTNDVD